MQAPRACEFVRVGAGGAGKPADIDPALHLLERLGRVRPTVKDERPGAGRKPSEAFWDGNSARVASKHHLQTTDADFDRAAGRTPATVPRGTRAAHKAAQSGADLGSLGRTVFPTGNKKGLEFQPCRPGSLADNDEKYARQESKTRLFPRENTGIPIPAAQIPAQLTRNSPN